MQAYVNDLALPNHQQPSWDQVYGPMPFKRVFEFEKQSGIKFWDEFGGQYVTLTLIAGGVKRVIKKIRAMRPVPASTDFYFAIEFADIRWAWQYAWLAVQYNVRRKSGDKRIVTKDILGNANIANDVEYHPATLNPPFSESGIPWVGNTSISDALGRINNQLQPVDQFTFTVSINSSVQLNNILIDTQGHTGLRQLLTNVPQAGIKVTDDGEIEVVDKLDGTEALALEEAGPAARERQVEMISDHSQIVPSEIDIMFGRECEVRFDDIGEELAAGSTVGQVLERFALEDRALQNVLSVTDPDNPDFAPSTWVEIARMLDNWGTHPVTGAKLTVDVLRRQWLHPHFLFGMAEFGQQRAEMTGDQSLWISRAASLKRHFYQTYRIPRLWMDRIQSLKANRVAILDEETGTRAPAQCWQDFALRYGDRAQRIAKQVLLYRNIDGYNVNLADGQISPALVTILEPDEGIIRITISLDAYGFAESTVPAAVDNGPTAKIGDVSGKPRWFGEFSEPGQIAPSLTATHRAAVILTAVPFAPPDLQRFQHVIVRPRDLQDRRVQEGLPETKNGPRLVIKVPEALITSRHAWQDVFEDDTKAAFGLRSTGAISLTDRMWNTSINRTHVEAIALALATVIYGAYVDRPIGSRTVHLNENIELTGHMRRLRHVITKQSGNTVIELDGQTVARTLFSVLPAEVQKQLGILVK